MCRTLRPRLRGLGVSVLLAAEECGPGDVVTLSAEEQDGEDEAVEHLLAGGVPVLLHGDAEHEDEHQEEGCGEGESGEEAEEEEDASDDLDYRDGIAGSEG